MIRSQVIIYGIPNFLQVIKWSRDRFLMIVNIFKGNRADFNNVVEYEKDKNDVLMIL